MQVLLKNIKPCVDANNMEAFIIGSDTHYDEKHETFCTDGRLLKIYPRGVRTRTILQIEACGSKFKVYNNRDSKLDGKFITEQEIVNFIITNNELAQKIIDEDNAKKNQPDLWSNNKPYQRYYSSERRTVPCRCAGEVETCPYCFGKGEYVIDGYGHKI